jgi:hypothetical protein
MTEAEWLAWDNPEPMLEFLRATGRASERKVRLFAVACCRHIWPWLRDGRSREAVDVAERHADGLVADGELTAAWGRASEAVSAAEGQPVLSPWNAAWAAWACAAEEPWEAAGYAWHSAMLVAGALAQEATWDTLPAGAAPDTPAWLAVVGAADAAAETAERPVREAQARLLRCLFGNPFRPVSFDPVWLAWHDGAVVKLAQSVYEDRELPSGHLDAARLAVLADMLEEAGCSDADLLGHLRGPGPHVRGCFAVDALLGKL